jgi:tetratricopeptide (TPR) repeat protein
MLYRSHCSMKSVMLVTGLGAVLAAASAFAALKEVMVHQQVSASPLNSSLPKGESILSSALAKLLRHIVQAQSAIHNKEIEFAKGELQQAETLPNIIEAVLPTTEIKDRISVAKKHLGYRDSEEVVPDLIAIYSALDEFVDFMPAKVAQDHLDRAKAHLEKGEKDKAKAELEAADEALLYTEIDLSVAGIRHLMSIVFADLAKGDRQDARKVLQAAENNVVFLLVSVQEAMVSAQSLLWAARQHYTSGDKKVARSETQQAITFLKAAKKSRDKVTRAEVGNLLGEAKALEAKMESSSDLWSYFEQLWYRSRALADRGVE